MSDSIQILVTKTFARWMRKSHVTNADIVGAAEEMVLGLIDASELKVLQELAASLLDLDQQAIAVAINAGQLIHLQGDE